MVEKRIEIRQDQATFGGKGLIISGTFYQVPKTDKHVCAFFMDRLFSCTSKPFYEVELAVELWVKTNAVARFYPFL